jgi:nucleotide-binding universal stress UspA family protein
VSGYFETDKILVVKGNPVEQILGTADRQNCDIIGMVSHGYGGLVGAFIGSTAKKVVRQSKKPVLVIRLPE